MADTYSQIYLQFVFAVKNRRCLIPKTHKEELHKYITGLVQNRNTKMIAIHCMPDHIHLFVGYKPAVYIPDLIKEIKVESNEFINKKEWTKETFKWQRGYGVFSYSQSHIGRVATYIANQEYHHRRKKFRDEYEDLLNKFEIPHKQPYLFRFFD